jgi:hypothetical protein
MMEETNVFAQDLSTQFAYIYPPAPIAEQVYAHARAQGGSFVLVLARDESGRVVTGGSRRSARLSEIVRSTPEGDRLIVAKAGTPYLRVPSGDVGSWRTIVPPTELIAILVRHAS